jgi:hypothetical protein
VDYHFFMATCSAIATRLDEEMLALRPAHVYPSHTPVASMPGRSGSAVASELGGRYLLRYLIRKQYSQFTTGTPSLQFTKPTAYSPSEAISWLALPTPARREFVLFLDPKHLSDVRGPRRVLLGGGLEYILASGFPATAIVVGWPVPVV